MLNSGSIAAGVVFNAMKKDSNIETMEATVPECFCPMCKSNNIEISETFEDESGMTFFALKCSDCGTRFVLLEDLINSIRRKIENAKAAEKHYSEILEQFSGFSAESGGLARSKTATRLTPNNPRMEIDL